MARAPLYIHELHKKLIAESHKHFLIDLNRIKTKDRPRALSFFGFTTPQIILMSKGLRNVELPEKLQGKLEGNVRYYHLGSEALPMSELTLVEELRMNPNLSLAVTQILQEESSQTARRLQLAKQQGRKRFGWT